MRSSIRARSLSTAGPASRGWGRPAGRRPRRPDAPVRPSVAELVNHTHDTIHLIHHSHEDLLRALKVHFATQAHHPPIDRHVDGAGVEPHRIEDDVFHDLPAKVLVAPEERLQQVTSADDAHHPAVGIDHG